MHKIISLEDAIQLEDPIFVDMRSPKEFADGCIPGALNIPLFTDKERAEVGTIYKNIGQEAAKQLGLSVVSTKLPDIVSQIRKLYQTGRTVIVYCWRGGMRSKSVVTVLDLMGIKAYQLLGGYKAYRRYVLDSLAAFPLKPEIVVLCGSTGVGKTTILNLLRQQGIPVIDLERLANHRGSAFGQVGLGRPATAQNFDSQLLAELRRLNDAPFIVVECESKRIGNVYLPDVLYQAMQRGRKILVHADIEIRIARLIEEYTDIYQRNHQAILESLQSLSKRLGKKKTDMLMADFSAGKLEDMVRVLLTDYYDPLYGYEKSDPASYDLVVNANDLKHATTRIVEFLQQLRR